LFALFLGIRRFGVFPLLVWLGLATGVLHFISIFNSALWQGLQAEGHTKQDFFGIQIAAGCAVYMFLLVLLTPILLEFVTGMPAGQLIEFFFTRALDRRIFLRAERMAQLVILIGPLLLNQALAPLIQKLDFGSEGIPIGPEPIVFAAWMTWAGILCIYLVAAYHLFAVKRIQKLAIQHNTRTQCHWRVLLAVYAPLLFTTGVIAIFVAMRINIYEQCFLWFARHLLLSEVGLVALVCVVQPLSGRNIQKLQFV
jgi:hypothetical protein